MTDNKRRKLLRSTLNASLVGIAASSGMLNPQSLVAAEPSTSNHSKSLDTEVTQQYNYRSMPRSSAINLSVPSIAENGAEVPVLVTTDLPDVESISILLKKNSSSLIAKFVIQPGTNAYVRTRIKIPASSDVIAIVSSKGKKYFTKKLVKVTTAGCGG